MDESQGDLGVVTEETPPTNNREEMSEDEKSAAEIERVFGPVDEKQQDVEQVTGLSESYLLRQFFLLFISLFIFGFMLLHFSVLFRPNLPNFVKTFFDSSLDGDSVFYVTFDGVNYSIRRAE